MESDEADTAPATIDHDFWLKASESSLDPIWDNSEDDIYAELLNR